MAGFALAEYVVPRAGFGPTIPGGTMPKAPNEKGAFFSQVQRQASKVPGPEHYNKEFLNKSFTKESMGGKFSTLPRGWGKVDKKSPAVGQYETLSQQCSPRTKGGTMPKRDRGCLFYDIATKQSKWLQAPGKYDAAGVGEKVKVLSFNSSKTESRNPHKPNTVGPGYYNPNFAHTEDRVPSYTGSKEPNKSFLELGLKQKANMPAPGHRGIPDSKVLDREGGRKHATMILNDREITPRDRFQLAGALTAR